MPAQPVVGGCGQVSSPRSLMSSPALISLHIPTPPCLGSPPCPHQGWLGPGAGGPGLLWAATSHLKPHRGWRRLGIWVGWALWAVDFIGTFQGCQMFPHGHGFMYFVI